jgi:isopropylmalate/homocitrate/citramalate synthase
MPLRADEPANVLTAAFQTPIEQPIQIWEQTLRDGEQTPGIAFTQPEKLSLARRLDALGVFGMNVGYPAVSEYEAETVRRIVALGLRAELAVTSRLIKEDVDAAAATGVHWAFCFTSLSDWHIKDKLKTTEAALLDKVREVVPYARSKGMKLSFAVEDATRTPLPRLLKFIQLAEELGANAIRVCDTVGVLVPTATFRLIQLMRPLVKSSLVMHFHNDMGMATANSLAALEAGADAVDATLNGLGERAGNTPLEELAVALQVKYGRDVGIKLDQLCEAAAECARLTGLATPHNKPITGSKVFSHESGIHVAGLLANPVTYEPFAPAMIQRQHTIIFGKHSGIAGVRNLLKRENMELSGASEKALLERIKHAGQSKEDVPEQRVLDWARELQGR